MTRFILLFLVILINCSESFAQIEKTDSTQVLVPISADSSIKKEENKAKFNIHKLPYFLDDFLLTAGVNRSSLYYSKNFRDLGHLTGYQIGLEVYTPLLEKAFLHGGVYFSARGFEHEAFDIQFRTYNIDLPMFLAYELPAFRWLDWRLILGAQLSSRVGSNQTGNYPIATDGDTFYRYVPSQFSKIDYGYVFGTSMEQGQFYGRIRIFTGIRKLMPNEQGMNDSFHLELGYFLFRGLRK